MRKTLRLMLLTLVQVAFFICTAEAQDRQITGKVTDENGSGLPGANILIKGTTRGTNTDAEGAFSLYKTFNH
ncbi:carboxypeptidase-like regulatory domain-containing protein [Dyadobacter pollutisoli]|jgi:hypothetical protein|uniref:Carboxypeptidase-like regulatory domain-containing protein n=1 Tax=Dyadobacter pollutisoli TaxID=2910158 RepID=A0A9E8SMH1_9BACT|nr:carboxypeptidase-like regulatory domain-containing protein [Dyadobacter pollutisoli]WAC09782.1 carboxypeptidase-like regulatory domain-containing protein [Dyadobacter pollutisoli]